MCLLNGDHRTIVAGVPAKIIGFRFSEEIIKKLEEIQWWNLQISELKELNFNNIEKCIEQLETIKNSYK